MKRLLSFTWVLIFLGSCTYRFDRAPNNTLSEFPEEFRGTFMYHSHRENDSCTVTISKNAIEFSDNHIMRDGGLSDSIKLAKGSKYYYLCFGDSLKNRYVWDVYPIRVTGNHMHFYALETETYKKAFKKRFRPVEGFNDLYYMDEKQLDKFCRWSLKRKHSIKLVRI